MTDLCYFMDLLLDTDAKRGSKSLGESRGPETILGWKAAQGHAVVAFCQEQGRGEAALGGAMKAERKGTKL